MWRCLKVELGPSKGKGKGKVNRTVLEFSALVEEILPHGEFVRFTGNEKANPVCDDELLSLFVEFMLFLQHLQYQITKEKLYISDWQGIGKLLLVSFLLSLAYAPSR